MFQRGLEQLMYMLVVQGIIHLFAFFAITNQPHPMQQVQLVTHRRLGRFQQRRQIRHAQLFIRQDVNQFQPGLAPQSLEGLGQVRHHLLGQHHLR